MIMNCSNSSRPLRVLYVARAPFISGAERALMSMLRHLDRGRVEPGLVLGHHTELVDQARELGIPVMHVPLPKRSQYNPLMWAWSVRRLYRTIRGFEPDVLHANDIPSCQAMSQLGERLKIPRVIHVRWVITAEDAAWWARCGAECVVCISQWVRAQLGDTSGTALRSAHVEVLHDGVDWPAMDGEAFDTTRVAVEPATLGFAGQLIESKGLDLVIEAMGRLPEGERPRLLVAGEDKQTGGSYQKQLEELAQRCGVAQRVTWLGFLDDVSQLYRRVTAVVCPSRIEPLGLVPLEAARFSLPAFANRLGGFTETIDHGISGYLVEPTVEAWAQALKKAYEGDTMARFGKAAHERTRQLFSPAAYQRRLIETYRRVVDTEMA